jgi:2-iminobutanoate/2-iminopropanoate deaminase
MKVISTDAAPRPVAAYSQAIEAGGFVYTAGQVGVDPATGKLADGLAAQAERAFENVRTILAAADLAVKDIAKITIYVTDLGEFKAVNDLYAKFVTVHRPARTTVGVATLPLGALIEVEAIAAV